MPETDHPIAPLRRDADAARGKRFDVIVVGGGIQGVCLHYEASRRGLRSVLVEREDFGGATSWNSMRILHGGLRYLQDCDLARYAESVRARRWFLRMFPGLTEPLDCMMPMYGGGLKRPGAFRIATGMNRALMGLEGRRPGEPRLSAGRALSARQVALRWHGVPRKGLLGGGLWADAKMLSPERMVVHLLRLAEGWGGIALNRMRARQLVQQKGTVRGVVCEDLAGGSELRLDAPVVLNAAGPWCAEVAKGFGDKRPELFTPVRTFNLILNREPFAHDALAVSPSRRNGRLYFLSPMGSRLVAGTGQFPCAEGDSDPAPSREEVGVFLDELNKAVPELEARESDIACVWSGVLPASYEGASEPGDRAIVLDHADHGGPDGLISVSGVKFTTAPTLARRVIDKIPGPPAAPMPDVPDPTRAGEIPGYGGSLDRLPGIVRDEAVVHVDDVVFRRTGLWQDERRAMEAFPVIAGAMGLEGERIDAERARLKRAFMALSRPWEFGGVGS